MKKGEPHNGGLGKSGGADMQPALSVVAPIYNEAESLPAFFEKLTGVLADIEGGYEIVAVDDGSSDRSFEVLSAFSAKDKHIRVIRFKRNFGQTAALSAGIDSARGAIIATIDSDLENDPADIPRLLAKLDEGYDVVSGWRKMRWQGAFLTRRLPSVMANWLISYMTGVPLHDYGCTLKVYRAEVIKDVRLYGEMHRFIPAYAAWQGGTVAELPVTHQPRKYGKSNYGFSRIFRVLLDLIVAVFMRRYMSRPMHFFGVYGFISLALGCTAGFVAVVLKVLGLKPLVETPLPILATLLILVGVQLLLFGVLAEILMRTYFESQAKRPYVIKETRGEKF